MGTQGKQQKFNSRASSSYKREVKTYLGDWETTHLILIRKSTAISEVNTAEIIDISTL